MLGFLAINMFGMTFILLMKFAKINSFFEVHMLGLHRLKQVLTDLLKYRSYYFSVKVIEQAKLAREPSTTQLESDRSCSNLISEESPINRMPNVKEVMETHKFGTCAILPLIFKPASDSHIHKRLVIETVTILGHSTCYNAIEAFLTSSVQSVDNIIKELEIDKKYQSIEILGFIITESFVFNLFVILSTIAIGFYQLFGLQ